MIKQLTEKEIKQVIGGHNDGTHAHLLGLHAHEILPLVLAIVATAVALYGGYPRLVISAITIAGIAVAAAIII